MLALGLPDPDPERFPNVTTVAGLVVTILGHVPEVGEVADYMGWRLEVVDMDARRVDQILAYRGHPTTAVQLPGRSPE
jgi:putative hemolysin